MKNLILVVVPIKHPPSNKRTQTPRRCRKSLPPFPFGIDGKPERRRKHAPHLCLYQHRYWYIRYAPRGRRISARGPAGSIKCGAAIG